MSDDFEATPDRTSKAVVAVDRPAFQARPYGNADFADPVLLAGHSKAAWIHVPALFLAALADIGALYQVVSLVMPERPWLVRFVVIGFAAMVLYLAHIVGVLLRERKAGSRWGRKGLGAWLCLVVWFLLGLCAYYVRVNVPESRGSQIPTGPVSPTSVTGGPVEAPVDYLSPGSLLFLALYLSSGLTTAVGAYLTHNPLRGAYAQARRQHRRAAREAAQRAHDFAAAAHNAQALITYSELAQQALREEQSQRRFLAESLKQHARLVIAQRSQDPALADALFGPDRRPHDRYAPPPGPSDTPDP